MKLLTTTKWMNHSACILLGLAWLLLLTSMFLPQVRVVYHGQNEILLYGWEVAVLAPFVAALVVLSGMAAPVEQFISIPLFLSDLLFIASPFILLKFKHGHLTGRSVYVFLNLVCLILWVPSTLQMVRSLDPTIRDGIQLLPNLFVWLGAQVALTLCASVQLLEAYRIERKE